MYDQLDETEIREEEQFLSITALERSWDANEDLSYDVMADQLGKLVDVMENRLTYKEFINVTQIKHNFIN